MAFEDHILPVLFKYILPSFVVLVGRSRIVVQFGVSWGVRMLHSSAMYFLWHIASGCYTFDDVTMNQEAHYTS